MKHLSSSLTLVLLGTALSGCADRQEPPAPVVHGDERRVSAPKTFVMPKEVYKPPAAPKTEEKSEDKIVLRETVPEVEEEAPQDKIVLRPHKKDEAKDNDTQDSSFEDEILEAVEKVPDRKKEEPAKPVKKDTPKKVVDDVEDDADAAEASQNALPTKFGEDPKKKEKPATAENDVKAQKPQKEKTEALPPAEEDDFFAQDADAALKETPKKKEDPAPKDNCVEKVDAAPPLEESSKTTAAPGPVRFSWPITGTILKEFSQESASKRNDGINIAASMKTPVKAGRAGTVVYLGNDIKGFGNLILVKHDGPWMSAYAHLDSFSVSQGAHLKEGQVLGYVGKSGGVKEPQLHFEVRKNSTPVNPRDFLG